MSGNILKPVSLLLALVLTVSAAALVSGSAQAQREDAARSTHGPCVASNAVTSPPSDANNCVVSPAPNSTIVCARDRSTMSRNAAYSSGSR